MYYPYFRGKQNELILIREQAKLISNSKIIPIIEPVKRNLSPLNRAIEQLDLFETEYILIVNPINGDFASDNSLIVKNLHLYKKVIIGLIITAETTLDTIEDYLSNFNDYKIADFRTEYNPVFPDTELDETTEPLYLISKVIYISDKVVAGKGPISFEDL